MEGDLEFNSFELDSEVGRLVNIQNWSDLENLRGRTNLKVKIPMAVDLIPQNHFLSRALSRFVKVFFIFHILIKKVLLYHSWNHHHLLATNRTDSFGSKYLSLKRSFKK